MTKVSESQISADTKACEYDVDFLYSILPDLDLKDEALRQRYEMGRIAVAEILGINLHYIEKHSPLHSNTNNSEVPERGKRKVQEVDILDTESRRYNMRRSLGRIATAPIRGFKSLDKWATYGVFNVVGKMPGMKSTQELNEAYYRRQMKYASDDSDGWLKSSWKNLMRNREKYALGTIPAAMGAIAASRFLGLDHSFTGSRNSQYRNVALGANSVELLPVQYNFNSSIIVAGGRGQGGMGGQFGAPIDQLRNFGYQHGVNVEAVGVTYPANIFPVDPMRMDDSLRIGAEDMYRKYGVLARSGSPVHLIGYSEGSGVAIDAANRIAAENGGTLPPNVHLTIIGTPYAEGGAFDSPFVKAISPVLNGMGIPTEKSIPPGTKVVYYDSDFWANSGNQVPTTMLRQLVELGFGGHDIPDVNGVPARTFVDSQGVEHIVYSRNDVILTALQNQGLYVADTAAANRAINALFPLDGGKPNVDLFTHELATTLSKNPDPISKYVANYIQNLPPEWKGLAQGGMDSFNDVLEGAAKIGAGDVVGGWNQMMRGLHTLSDVVPNKQDGFKGYQPSDWARWIGNSTADMIKGYTGKDYRQEINDFITNKVAPRIDNRPLSEWKLPERPVQGLQPERGTPNLDILSPQRPNSINNTPNIPNDIPANNPSPIAPPETPSRPVRIPRDIENSSPRPEAPKNDRPAPVIPAPEPRPVAPQPVFIPPAPEVIPHAPAPVIPAPEPRPVAPQPVFIPPAPEVIPHAPAPAIPAPEPAEAPRIRLPSRPRLKDMINEGEQSSPRPEQPAIVLPF